MLGMPENGGNGGVDGKSSQVIVVEVTSPVTGAPKDSAWEYTWMKLRAWSLIQYSKIVFLDADQIVLKNMDYLFDEARITTPAGCKSAIGSYYWDNIQLYSSNLLVVEPVGDAGV